MVAGPDVMIALCLSLLAGGAQTALPLPSGRFTLAWTHSIEKVEWQEDWLVDKSGLTGREARIKGSGAGMEPPAFARLEKGWYRWPMPPAAQERLVLARSDAVADHNLCVEAACRPLSQYIGGVDSVILEPCHAP
jgi:hypothetical protein